MVGAVFVACGGRLAHDTEAADAGAESSAMPDATFDSARAPDAEQEANDAACANAPDEPIGPHGTPDPAFGDGGSAIFQANDLRQLRVFGLPNGSMLFVDTVATEGIAGYYGRNEGTILSANGSTLATRRYRDGDIRASAQAPDNSVFLVTQFGLADPIELGHIDANGAVDTGFGFPTLPFTPVAMAVSPMGEPIVASDGPDLVFERFAASGSLVSHITLRYGIRAKALARNASGHVVVAGVETLADGTSRLQFARLLGDQEDSSLGDGGWATLPVAVDPVAAAAIAVDASDRILVAATTSIDVVVARFTPQGQLDPCFGDHGVTHLHERGATAIAVQTNGKVGILVEAGLRGLDTRGAVDAAFGTTVPASSTRPGDMTRAIAALDVGGLGAAYPDTRFGSWNLAVVRLNP